MMYMTKGHFLSNYICKCGVSNIDSDEGYVQGCDCHNEEQKKSQIDFDIIREIIKLRQQVADMETAKAFSVSIFDNIVTRLNDVERRMDRTDKALLSIVELRDMRGKA